MEHTRRGEALRAALVAAGIGGVRVRDVEVSAGCVRGFLGGLLGGFEGVEVSMSLSGGVGRAVMCFCCFFCFRLSLREIIGAVDVMPISSSLSSDPVASRIRGAGSAAIGVGPTTCARVCAFAAISKTTRGRIGKMSREHHERGGGRYKGH